MRRKLALLVWKDLYLNRYALLLSFLGSLVFVLLLGLMRPFPSVETKMTLLVTVNLFMSTGYGDWLTCRERAKGTLVTLRLLPVPDMVLVGSKFLVCFLAQTVTFGVSAALLTPDFFFYPRLWSLLLIWLGLVCFGCLMLLTKTVFSHRVGQVLPFLVLAVPLLAFMKMSEFHPEVRRFLAEAVTTAFGAALLSFAAVGFIALTWLGAWLWLRTHDSCQLID
jgi:hypothetical protein